MTQKRAILYECMVSKGQFTWTTWTTPVKSGFSVCISRFSGPSAPRIHLDHTWTTLGPPETTDDALNEISNVVIHGEKADNSFRLGDEWVIEIPAQHFERAWSLLEPWAIESETWAEADVTPAEEMPTEESAAGFSTTSKLLMGGGVAGAALLISRYVSLK